ncbi:uncharacterized protein K452DRAFT_300175 [Aplosporella prunicola CBS 121167]|uniref:Nuclear GTPase SLIP-GC n=1 Tax=Aplosporella prunicola CBS 121167 TaxID=1176127 RepID=A0A6A6BAU5_9PEZI|nr:uncharacterized protein K452DRAFT_300175 [Aplosporella prunicola CBS 121167]KAF2139631.1 hypothetical protein K452DRAFT_300175 [Aplosporella prunicola CBS 121167]
MENRTAITAAEYAELRDRAKSVKPNDFLKPTRFWVAVLIHGKDATTVSEQADFLWIKANGKTKVKAVYAEYVKRHSIDVELYLGPDQVQEDSKLMDLNKFDDNTTIFISAPKSPSSSAPESASSATAAAAAEKSVLNPTGTADTQSLASAPKQLPQPLNQSVTPTPIQHHQPPASLNINGTALRESSRASTTLSNEPNAKPSNPYLQKLLSETSPEKLEEGVEKALDIMKDVRKPLDERKDNADAKQWLESLEILSKQFTRNRTVIGVVGNTGAGKSSVINALLDEERLVPTNCMRACTAVVTELSWNDSDRTKYRSDIEFIKPEDWRKELDILFKDLLDQSGNVSKDCSNPDTDAGIAWAKIKSVYPQKTKEMLAEGGPDMLLRDAEVKKVLGTTKHINEDDSKQFYKRLQFFVDSQEKVTGPDGRRKEKIRMEYWPLIKVVKIYTRAEALSTGAVMVDLPGVQDSNAARAAVAAGYMKQCTGLWILAPITRAVDDKAAKTLLGDTFKRQLKLDGTYGNVTFICSKTDEISLQEAVAGLGLGDEMEQSWAELDSMAAQLKDLEGKLDEAKTSKDVYKEVVDECDDEIEAWEDLEEKVEEGKTVFAPNPNFKQSKKRKRDSPAKKPRKKKRRVGDTDDDPIEVEDECTDESDHDSSDKSFKDGDSDSGEQEEQRQPLTEEDVASKLRELKSRKKEARRSRVDIDQKISEIQDEQKDLRKKHSKLRAEISAKCISGRNNYSRHSIQHDFAAGIKELDQENAQDEDEENFDPDTDIRDYAEVARSLPVFCVSSRAYQKLCGRLKRDDPVHGFNDISETEMPQLQAHCKKLTEAGRSAASRRFLNNLSQTLTSLSLWASKEGRGAPMTAGQHRKEVAFLEFKLAELERGLNEAVDKCLSEMISTLTTNIYQKWDNGIRKAIDDALPTADGWGAHRSIGGLLWPTYKAIVRRDGAWTGRAGPRDFNEELMAPVIKSIASNWEKCFQRQLPVQVASFTDKVTKLLKNFHKDVQRRAHDNGVSIARLSGLSQQLQNYEPFLKEQIKVITDQMNDIQREANREFTPAIAAAMRHAYSLCANESGTGSYVRMKSHMHTQVDRERRTMFQVACNTVKAQLTLMCDKVKSELAIRAKGVYQTARRDYATLLGNLGSVDKVEPPEDHELKSKVHEVVEGAEEVFRRLVEGEDNEEAAEKGEEEGENEDEKEDEKDKQNQDEEEHSERLHQETEAGPDAMDVSKSLDTSEAPDTTVGAVAQDRAPLLGDLVAYLDDNKENISETTDKTGSLKQEDVENEDTAFNTI